MSTRLSVTPGFSPVKKGNTDQENRFNGLPFPDKPLERPAAVERARTRLKPGVHGRR